MWQYTPYTPYLQHHGIKGQKWGVRRFQNYDGTRIKAFNPQDERSKLRYAVENGNDLLIADKSKFYRSSFYGDKKLTSKGTYMCISNDYDYYRQMLIDNDYDFKTHAPKHDSEELCTVTYECQGEQKIAGAKSLTDIFLKAWVNSKSEEYIHPDSHNPNYVTNRQNAIAKLQELKKEKLDWYYYEALNSAGRSFNYDMFTNHLSDNVMKEVVKEAKKRGYTGMLDPVDTIGVTEAPVIMFNANTYKVIDKWY